MSTESGRRVDRDERDEPHVSLQMGDQLGGPVRRGPLWLWEPYLAFGTLSVLDGDPGVGKSLLTIDIAARLGTDREMPDGRPPTRNPVADSFILTTFVNAEDGVRQTIVPRLLAADGEPAYAAFLGDLGEGDPNAVPVSFPRDLEGLATLLRGFPGGFVVLDPMMALFSKEVAANNDQAIREALTPLAQLAAETSSCVLLVRHLTKRGGARKALYRGSGSIGILGACRTALVAERHPDDPTRCVLAMTKSNLGPIAPSLSYRVEGRPEQEVIRPLIEGQKHPVTGGDVKVSGNHRMRIPASAVVMWEGQTPLTSDELCSAKPDLAPEQARAAEWLRKVLANGPVAARTIEAMAQKEGISYGTLRLAKLSLKVQSRRFFVDGRQHWEWMLRESTGGEALAPLAPLAPRDAQGGFEGELLKQP